MSMLLTGSGVTLDVYDLPTPLISMIGLVGP